MKIDGGRIINDFFEPNKRQYAIPVYQRNYEWSREQCEKLFNDIIAAYRRDMTHFCGSVVYAQINEEHNIHYYVIVDGQQRLTTIYLLLKALIDNASTESEKEAVSENVFNYDRFDEYKIDTQSKLKLKPIKTDNQQLFLLMDNKFDEIDKSSGIWQNYSIFCELIKQALEEDPDLDVKKIKKGIDKLTCAMIKLDDEDNAQEIFERINSTGVPLSLADQIRNYVLMTDADQDYLYETYWLKIEQAIQKNQMSEFFINYLNMKSDGFIKEKTGYKSFKELNKDNAKTNEEMLKELLHYAEIYRVFLYGSDKFSKETNSYLYGFKCLKQTTVYLFLFKVFDDYYNKIIDENELERILQFLLSYSIRRLICEVPSNSLRGFYKTLHSRVFSDAENKNNYYDAIVSFMQQVTSKDVVPNEDDYIYALKNNNLYAKHALCRYLLIALENQGKEKVLTDTLSIEHVMPQNKNLSTAWQRMLGNNWLEVREKWLHTLGNLTLTGYNSELGDKPFDQKKTLLNKSDTKITHLCKDIINRDKWNADTIQSRAERLAEEVLALFPIVNPKVVISFEDKRYHNYTCEEPSNATNKAVSHYEILGERVNVDTFAGMLLSVAEKLYSLDGSIIEDMAKNNETIKNWAFPLFSYDSNILRKPKRLKGTDIYMLSGFSACDIISVIRELLIKHDLNIKEDFIYSAREYNSQNT